jgi:DNA-binding MarR family transcriptional regulator
MTVSKTATASGVGPRKALIEGASEGAALEMGELSDLLGYSLKRAQLRIFEDFLRCVAPLQLTPAQFSVLLLLEKNPGRNQTEIANTLGILRPNFVAMLDGLESRDLCTRVRSTNDRRPASMRRGSANCLDPPTVLRCFRCSKRSRGSSDHRLIRSTG